MDTSDDIILIRLAGFSVQSILPRDVFSAIHFRFVVEAVLHAICSAVTKAWEGLQSLHNLTR